MIVGGMFPSKNWWGVLYRVVHTFKTQKKIFITKKNLHKKTQPSGWVKSMSNLKKKRTKRKTIYLWLLFFQNFSLTLSDRVSIVKLCEAKLQFFFDIINSINVKFKNIY